MIIETPAGLPIRPVPARGYFGVGIYGAKTSANVGLLWRSAMLRGAAFVFTVGARYRHRATDTPRTPQHTPLHHYRDLEDLLEHLPEGCPLIGIERDPRAVPLPEYTHPERAAYLLSADDSGLPLRVVDSCHGLVSVPTLHDVPDNVAVAGAIVINDRYTKMGATQ